MTAFVQACPLLAVGVSVGVAFIIGAGFGLFLASSDRRTR